MTSKTHSTTPPQSTFPVQALPEPIQSFVVKGAESIGCDPSFIALPLLTSFGAAIGNTRSLKIKESWETFPILWTAIVAESGTCKTPAFDLALSVAREAEAQSRRKYNDEWSSYKERSKEWKKSPSRESEDEPKPPVCKRLIVGDTTVEALAPIFLENPRGLLLACDELASWFGSFDRYSSGGRSGSDSARWLPMHKGSVLQVDRRTGEPKSIYIPSAALSITGTIQPGTLIDALRKAHRDSGLAARILFTYPPRSEKQWTGCVIPPELQQKVALVFKKLMSLNPEMEQDDEGNHFAAPKRISWTDQALNVFKASFNQHNRQAAQYSGDKAKAWSKLEETPARIALILHYIRWATGEVMDESKVDITSLNKASELTKWFKTEMLRIYDMIEQGDTTSIKDKTINWLRKQRQPVSPRDAQQYCRAVKPPGKVWEVFEELVTEGKGRWVEEGNKKLFELVLDRQSSPSGTGTKRSISPSTEADSDEIY